MVISEPPHIPTGRFRITLVAGGSCHYLRRNPLSIHFALGRGLKHGAGTLGISPGFQITHRHTVGLWIAPLPVTVGYQAGKRPNPTCSIGELLEMTVYGPRPQGQAWKQN